MSREARTGRRSYARGLAWAGLLAMLAASLSGCSWICTWCAGQQPAANRAPQIKALYAEQAGKRVRWVQPGSTVVVRAQAKDADGDALRYRWEVAPGSGRLLSGAGPTAVWDVGSGAGQKTLRLAVSDGRGGLARSDLGLAAGPKPVFSGQIVSAAGGPVPLAAVEVNGQGAVADREGRFAVALDDANAERFLFNARKPGHGLVSSLHDHVVVGGRWVMTPATVQSIDPAVANLVRDLRSRENCQGPQSARVNWHLFPRQRVPRVFDGSGAPVAGAIPAQLREAVDFVLAGTECSPGISLQIPANALVGPQGTPPAGNVDVSVSTVDIFAPNGLPGDLTVQTKTGNRVMQSYGAGTLAASAGGQAYQLRPGAAATLTVPVDPAQLKRKTAIPATIPLLLYNPAYGVWTEAGTARLNEAGNAYVGLVTHFSEYNMDLVKTDQSCVRVDASALPGSFEMDVVVPMGGAAPVVRHHIISEDPAHPEPRLHALYNLPGNTWIGLIPMHEVGGTLVPYGIFGLNTGAPQAPTDPNRPAYPYDACRSEVALADLAGTVAAVVDGTASHSAPLPRHIYDLVDAGATDIYPVGAGELYLFSLFDTGSNIVLIKDSDAALLNMGAASAGNANQDVDVRISGLNGIDPVTFNGTIYAPGGPGGAQAQVSGIRAGIRTLGESLIGTPVATQAVALIDYTRTVSRGPNPYWGTVEGPDITFYAPGDPAAPVPQLALQLERFGSAGTSGTDNATREQRYLLRNVAFRHGVNVANDDPAAPDPRYFSFDTGSRVVIISLDMATALGIDTAADGILDCWSDAGHPGNEMYKVDAITLSNPDGSYYQVNNASVCVDKLDDKIVTTVSPGNKVDAVFGMNVFMQAPVIVDGPANTLGIGIAAP